MKTRLFLSAVAMLTLSACDAQQTEMNRANAQAVADEIEAQADRLDAMAANATTPMDAAAIDNAADQLANSGDAVQNAATTR